MRKECVSEDDSNPPVSGGSRKRPHRITRGASPATFARFNHISVVKKISTDRSVMKLGIAVFFSS